MTSKVILAGLGTFSFVSSQSLSQYTCHLAKTIPVRIPNNAATGIATWPNSVVCISGIGQHDLQQRRIAPPGYDIANVWKRRTPPTTVKAKLRFLMSKDQQKEWKNFEPIYKGRAR